MPSIAVARRPDLTAYRDTDALSALIATIYDAAIDPAIWPDVLRAATTYLGGQSSAIYAKNISGTQFEIFQVDGQLEEKYAVQYFETYSRLDPATAGQTFLISTSSGRVASTRSGRSRRASSTSSAPPSRNGASGPPCSVRSATPTRAWSMNRCASACATSCRISGGPC